MDVVLDEYEIASDTGMILSKLLNGVAVSKMFQTMYGRMVVTHEVEVNHIQYDSRNVERGDLFVAIRGVNSDGHKYIDVAINKGAKVVVVEDDASLPDSYFMHAGVVKIVVPNTRIALSRMSANYFDRPAEKLLMVGVTGTNGKTTTTHLIQSILQEFGKKTGMIGTISYTIGNESIPATHTTPESLELNQLLSRFIVSGCTSAVMEVSSHALHQHRVYGFPFAAGVFTNLTQDHLDYHGTIEEYFIAKKMLFDSLPSLSWAIVNVDDPWGKKIYDSVKSNKLSYGLHGSPDVGVTQFQMSMQETSFTLLHGGERTEITSQLIGRFNISNILAAFATGVALDIPKQTIVNGIRNVRAVRGRFEKIIAPQGWIAIVDYAHTPDALEKTLKTIHDVFDSSTRGRIITVFGCGGNRDRTKRPKMATIVSDLSDTTIVTSDNPRHEDADAIIDEIMTGIKTDSDVHRETDRGIAIEKALGMAKRGDVVLIAGKGHEDYQVVGDIKIHFSDREVVEEFIRVHA
jgi:UDP-N-acetylmuramoyl-L-alanyl-D-glutamate--2,6-diaminopimelate ligase